MSRNGTDEFVDRVSGLLDENARDFVVLHALFVLAVTIGHAVALCVTLWLFTPTTERARE